MTKLYAPETVRIGKVTELITQVTLRTFWSPITHVADLSFEPPGELIELSVEVPDGAEFTIAIGTILEQSAFRVVMHYDGVPTAVATIEVEIIDSNLKEAIQSVLDSQLTLAQACLRLVRTPPAFLQRGHHEEE